MDSVETLRRLIEKKSFLTLKERVSECDLGALAGVWREFKPMEKLVLFKLFSPLRALEFYSSLDLNAKYFLLCAFDLNSIAPVLEGLPTEAQNLFRTLPDQYYDRMLGQLACEQVEIEVAVRNN